MTKDRSEIEAFRASVEERKSFLRRVERRIEAQATGVMGHRRWEAANERCGAGCRAVRSNAAREASRRVAEKVAQEEHEARRDRMDAMMAELRRRNA